MASTVWKGYLSFGLISVPIRLFAGARSERVSFNQLHKECHSRIKQLTYCPKCDRTVERSELMKGYEYAKESYVLVEEEEIKKLAPSSAETMEILEFVKIQEVDPLYFDTSYYAVPEGPGRKAYQLLVQTMEHSGYAALAKLSMHQREYTVLIRPRENGLTLHTMHYADEVRQVAEYGQVGDIEVKPQEIQLAQQLVESLAASFQPEKYRDGYQQRLQEMIEAKRQGQEIAAPQPVRLAPVIDLMEALQKSLSEVPKKPAARAAATAMEARAVEASVAPKRARRKAAR
jgi:DNA end-binding protein Ku